jgi:SAM-dependent methyltransferase
LSLVEALFVNLTFPLVGHHRISWRSALKPGVARNRVFKCGFAAVELSEMERWCGQRKQAILAAGVWSEIPYGGKYRTRENFLYDRNANRKGAQLPVKARDLLDAAADLAAAAALFEIADELGIFGRLECGAAVSAEELADTAGTPVSHMETFLGALAAAGLVVRDSPSRSVRVTDAFPQLRTAAGYLCWALKANRPFIENSLAFFKDHDSAARLHTRNSRDVAVTSRWVGLGDFYPTDLATLVNARPSHLVDLGAGAAQLLIDALIELPDATAVALDISPAACAVAAKDAAAAGVANRLCVVQRSIESLVDDPSPIAGADVIHSGFSFHDLVPDTETFGAVLRSCKNALTPNGFLAITDAVPYSAIPRERLFSSLFTYLHEGFMNVRLPTEEAWRETFLAAGFSDIRSIPHKMPGARLFIVK